MLIGIDCRLWKQTGVGRYSQNLVKNLSLIDPKNNYILFARKEDHEEVKKVVGKNFKTVICNVKWHSLEEQALFSQTLGKYKLDLMHFPYFSVPYFYRKKFVVTVHDLIINKFDTGKASTLPYPIYKVKRLGYNFILKNALKNSRKIIAPSFSVKNDIISNYKNIDPQKIDVTYEGSFDKVNENKKILVKEKYLLRVGNFYPHKNVESLLLAFQNLKQKDIKLVLVGKKDYFFKRIWDKINELKITKKVIFFENPSDSSLSSLYKNSIATIVPSFMEGFSLTATEAMSQGSIVIASDIAVHREICKDSVVYFDPYNVKDLENKINLVLSFKDSKKTEFIEKEQRRAKYFSWEKMAKETLNIYESSISLR